MSEITRESVLQTMKDAAERMGLALEDLQEMIEAVLEDCSAKCLNSLGGTIWRFSQCCPGDHRPVYYFC